MTDRLAELTARRLLLVTGKGGTGKSTVSAALGLLAAKQGIDTVVIEVGESPVLPRLLTSASDSPNEGDGRTPIQVAPHLYTLRIVPEIALTEYLELQLRVKPIVGLMMRNPGFQRLLAAAPGWRALITLGKLWHLQSQSDQGRPRWALLIVDAPSTGHGLSFLSVPNVVLDAVRLAPLRKHTEGVRDLLQDASRTLVLPVSLAEELPVNETLQLCAHVRELGLALGPLIANAVEPGGKLPETEEFLPALGRLAPPAEFASWFEPELVARCLDHRRKRNALQRRFIERLRAESPQPVLELPQVPDAIVDRKTLSPLAHELETKLSEKDSPR